MILEKSKKLTRNIQKNMKRTKYFQRTHKDLIKYGEAESINGVSATKFK